MPNRKMRRAFTGCGAATNGTVALKFGGIVCTTVRTKHESGQPERTALEMGGECGQEGEEREPRQRVAEAHVGIDRLSREEEAPDLKYLEQHPDHEGPRREEMDSSQSRALSPASGTSAADGRPPVRGRSFFATVLKWLRTALSAFAEGSSALRARHEP
jgi:hypothetical protein